RSIWMSAMLSSLGTVVDSVPNAAASKRRVAIITFIKFLFACAYTISGGASQVIRIIGLDYKKLLCIKLGLKEKIFYERENPKRPKFEVGANTHSRVSFDVVRERLHLSRRLVLWPQPACAVDR